MTSPQLCGALAQDIATLACKLNTAGFELMVTPQTCATTTTTKTTKVKSMKRAASKGNTSTSKQSQGVSSYWKSIKTHMGSTGCSLSQARGWYKSQN
jgi:hypothetical protein